MANKTEFKQQYDWIQDQITQSKLLKALPIARSKTNGHIKSRLPSILGKIIQDSNPSYSYGFWNSKAGLVGSTPEVLSNWNQKSGELKTMALAGTWAKSSVSSLIDFSDFKIKAEHDFVIQDILNQLHEFKLLHKSETKVEELPYLYHLKTNFIYKCETIQKYIQAIHLLHPTAALGLFPREFHAACEFSRMSIQEARQQFGAPLGFLSNDKGFMLVAIRNIMWTENNIELFAGCGVTGKSSFEEEWQEILAKQDSVKKMLGVES